MAIEIDFGEYKNPYSYKDIIYVNLHVIYTYTYLLFIRLIVVIKTQVTTVYKIYSLLMYLLIWSKASCFYRKNYIFYMYLPGYLLL